MHDLDISVMITDLSYAGAEVPTLGLSAH